MPNYLCTACGTEFPPSASPPPECRICSDERQFVPLGGQSWTTLEALRSRHANSFRQYGPDAFAIQTTPAFAIGQRAWLILSPFGNVLWDCIALIDDATVSLLKALGGVAAIAISHPHFYTTMGRWAEAFGAPVYLHQGDRQWVVRDDPHLVFWDGDGSEIGPGLTLLRLGGHFAGGTVLHRADPEGGTLFCGDILQVAPDRRHVSFMRSYPNMTPLSAAVVQRIAARLDPWRYDRVCGAFADREIMADGEEAVRRSVERYVAAVSGRGPADAER